MNKKKSIDIQKKIELKGIKDAVSDSFGTDKVSVFIRKENRITLPQNIMVFQEFAYSASIFCSPTALKILMYLFSTSGYENLVAIEIQTMSEELKISERTVIRAFNELIKYNVVNKFKNKADRRINDYFINPVAAWKGNSYARKQFMSKMEDKKQLSLFGKDDVPMIEKDSVNNDLKENDKF